MEFSMNINFEDIQTILEENNKLKMILEEQNKKPVLKDEFLGSEYIPAKTDTDDEIEMLEVDNECLRMENKDLKERNENKNDKISELYKTITGLRQEIHRLNIKYKNK